MVNRRQYRSLYNVPFRSVLPYLALPLLLYAFMVFAPIVSAAIYSLHTTLGWTMDYSGLANYAKVFGDPVFWISLRNNILFILVSMVFQLGLALVLSTFFITKSVWFPKTVRAIFFFPCIVSSIVISYLWRIIYSNQYGLMNKFLGLIGLGFLKQNWLSDPNVVLLSVSIPLAWQFIGFYLILLLAGLSTIDESIFEVAQLDGVKGPQMLWSIVLPLLKNSIVVSMILCASGGVKIFEPIYAITNGGPGYTSSVLAQYAYQVSFAHQNYGYGAAISVMMMLVSLILVLIVKLPGAKRGDLG